MLADILLQMHETFVFLLLQNYTSYLALNIKSGNKIVMEKQSLFLIEVFQFLPLPYQLHFLLLLSDFV